MDGPSTRIHIPADKVCWVIGQRGATIKDIQRKTGTIVQVDTDDDRNGSLRTILIAGTEEQQQAAIAEINRVIARRRARASSARTSSRSRTAGTCRR